MIVKAQAIVALLRPQQWLKNLMLLFPAFLGGVLVSLEPLAHAFLPLLAFCLASSAGYVFNDLLDCRSDAEHPRKKRRPIPAGLVSRQLAVALVCGLGTAAVLLAVCLDLQFAGLLVAYLVVTATYSLWLKHQPLFDLFCIVLAFLLRLQAGGVIFSVRVSEWLFLSVFLLALFLSAGKRLGEQQILGAAAGGHRRVLEKYPEGFLYGSMLLAGAAALVTYAIYTVSHPLLVYTVPLCAFGLLRYLMVVSRGASGDPTESLLHDPVLFAVGAGWALLIGLALYGR